MSSLSTKTNKSRSAPSALQRKAASKSQIKKKAVAKATKPPTRKITAKALKKTVTVSKKAPAKASAKTSLAKKAGTKLVAVKAAAKKVVKKPVVSVKPSAKKNLAAKVPVKTLKTKRVSPKVEAKTAEVQARRQESRAAVEAFEKALKLFSRQDFASAKAAFEQILEKFSTQTDLISGVRKYLAVIEQKLTRTPSLPKSPDALYDRGVFEFNKANFQEAINFFEKALKAQPTAAHVLYSLAAAYAHINNIKKALDALRQATTIQAALRSRARSDNDFSSLYDNEDFRFLTGYGFDIQE